MKTAIINSRFAPLSQTDLATLTRQVTETVATELRLKPTFTAAELWDIQRRTRTRAIRRFI